MSTSIDPTTASGSRALERLATETVGWLTTVNPDGAPQSSPVWFVWEDGEVRLYSWIRAPRNDNLRERPAVAFNLDTEAEGDSYVTMEGTARMDAAAGPASADARFMAKYGGRIEGYGWSTDYYDTNYPLAIRITPTRWRMG